MNQVNLDLFPRNALHSNELEQPASGISRSASVRIPVPALRTDSVEISPQARELAAVVPQVSNVDDGEDLLSEFSPEEDMKIQLIKALFGDESVELTKERLEKIQKSIKENQEALDSAMQEASQAQTGMRVMATRVSAETQEIEIRAEDGSILRIQRRHLEMEQLEIGTGAQNQSDPLVLDLDGDGIETTTAKEGVVFDIDGDGNQEKTAFATGGDGFLAVDHNLNGIIDSGMELFGDQHGAVHGFAELARYDGNGDEKIDADDEIYDKLLVYREENYDGVSQQEELTRLSDHGITAIWLNYQDTALESNGNRISQLGQYSTVNGIYGNIGDLWLNYLA